MEGAATEDGTTARPDADLPDPASAGGGEPDAVAGAGKQEFDKMLIAKTMTMLTDGDKALALATAGAYRSLEREKRLWAQERKDWKMCCLQLDRAQEAFTKVRLFAEEKECTPLLQDETGGFLRQPGVDSCTAQLNGVREVAMVREEGDRSAVEAQDIVLNVANRPIRWKPWHDQIEADIVLQELDRARRLCFTALAAYNKIDLLSGLGESEDYERETAVYDLRQMASRTPSGIAEAREAVAVEGRPVKRVMGRKYLETIVFRQLEQEEEKARHRMAGDAYSNDCDEAIRGKVEGIKTTAFCARMFATIDEDGSGAIDGEELRAALMELNVYLSDEAVQNMILDIDVDRNGTIEAEEWEVGIVKAQYKVYMYLAMAQRFAADAEKEYLLAGASDRKNSLFHLRMRIDKITPINERERMIGSLWGVVCGDALGMPTDGSVNLRARGRDYGYVTAMQPPYPGPHADGGMHLGENSDLKSIGTEATQLRPRVILEPSLKSDIMGGKEILFSQKGVHPHRCLVAGCNTLSGQITNLFIQSLAEAGTYDREHFLELYVRHMLNQPDKDVHIDAVHVEFFERYARGNKAYYSAGLGSGASEAITFCLVNLVPLIVSTVLEEEARDRAMSLGDDAYSISRIRYSSRHPSPAIVAGSLIDLVYQHTELFFRSEKLQQYAHHWATLLKRILLGYEPIGELREAARQENMDLELLLEMPDEEVVGIVYNGSNWVDHCYPCVLFLSIKYRDEPEAAMQASANLGGDSACRTALVGAIMGAMHGYTSMPLEWREGVLNGKSLAGLIDQMVHQSLEKRGKGEAGIEGQIDTPEGDNE